MVPQNPTSKPRVAAALRRQEAVHDAKEQLEAADALSPQHWEALNLRGVDRLSYQRIAERLGVSVSTARRYVVEGLEQVQAATREEAEEVRAIELLALDEMQSVFVPMMREGNVQAANVLIKVAIRRDRLLRLSGDSDAPDVDENDVVDFVPVTADDLAEEADKGLNADLAAAAEEEPDA